MGARPRNSRIGIGVSLAALACLAALVATASGIRPVGGDTRVTVLGADGDANIGMTEAFNDIAYSSKRNEYLAVVTADAAGTDGDYEIFGQRLSAAGQRIGGTFRISHADAAGRESVNAAVAYSAKRNEYMVVFRSNQLAAAGDNEIFGQRLSATGAELGGDFRVSNALDAGANRDADLVDIEASAKRGTYLVAFEADAATADGEEEIFVQRLSGTGAELGGDRRITAVGPEGDGNREARAPVVAYGAKRDQFLVAYQADALVSDKVEIFAQRIAGADGAEVGGDFRVSSIGADADIVRDVAFPAIAYGAKKDDFLVVFAANGLAAANEEEIFARRVSSAGAALGDDFRVSVTGADGDGARAAEFPDVAYSRIGREYVVAWHADGLTTNNEFDIFGQRIAAGGRLLDGNFQISRIGADGDPERLAFFPALAASTKTSQMMSVFTADGLPTDDEYELFGHRLSAPRCGGRLATITGSSLRDKLKGTGKRDVIAALGGNDVIKGLGGGDFLCGGAGRDKLAGGKQKDRLIGGGGKDTCSGGPSKDRARSCERSATL